MPTKQQTFDAVVEHLRRQGRKALSPNGKCAYRGEDGTKCAAGCLIPDDRYEARIEGDSVYAIRSLFADLGHNVRLVSELQDVHDGYVPDGWEEALACVADQFSLTYTPPEPAQ